MVLAVLTIWRNGDSTGKATIGIVLMAGAVGAVGIQVTFLTNRMFGNMNILEQGTIEGTTDIRNVGIGIGIGVENDTEGNIQSEAEAATGETAGIGTGKGDLGTPTGEVEAQEDIVTVVGMIGEENLFHY